MQRTGQELLQIGVERGYLDSRTAAHLLAEADDRGCSPELLLRQTLSPRRVARLRNHHRYRTMRKVDKLYAAMAIRGGHLTKTQVLISLKHQKRRFEGHRQCVRLGSHLIERGLLTFDEDRILLARVTGSKLPSEVVRSVEEVPSSAATLALDEESMPSLSTQPSSYAQIEEAVRRVDHLRNIQNDLSTSDNVGTDAKRGRGDSANEIENALTVLARRRLGNAFAHPPMPPEPKRKRKKRKKTTGLMRIFRLGAA